MPTSPTFGFVSWSETTDTVGRWAEARIRIPHDLLLRARLTPFDRVLIRDCNRADATVADRVLALETLVRRCEEAAAAAVPERTP